MQEVIFLKKLCSLLMLFLIVNLTSCTLNQPMYIHFEQKKMPNYYLAEIALNISKKIPFTVNVYDCNVCNSIKLDDNESNIIPNFIKSLSTDSYLEESAFTDTVQFKLIITFSNSQTFLINIYNESIATVYPYDGIFPPDIVDMNTVAPRYNLLDFCSFIVDKKNNQQ